MEPTWPTPQTWRETVYLAVAIILAATYKRIINGIAGFWRNFRVSPSQAAQADKIHAEADSIRTHDAIGTATLIREMTVSMGEAELLEKRLKEKLATQESTINLLKIENKELKERNAELEDAQAKKA